MAVRFSGSGNPVDINGTNHSFHSTLMTSQASTSGTSIDFTSIPSWVKRITVIFHGVSTNGGSQIQVQIGSGSITSSGYSSICVTTSNSAGFQVTNSIAASASFGGTCGISLVGSNQWAQSSVLSGNVSCQYGAGSVTLSGTLDRVRITTVNGTDTFDAGSINVMYE